MRGRKPIPTVLKLIRGNPGKRALRSEPRPTQSAEPPEPPDFLMKEAVETWRSLASELTRLGLLTSIDLHIFAAYCQSAGRWLVAERLLAELGENFIVVTPHGGEVPHPLLRIASSAADAMLKFGSEFGLSPASRARLGSFEGPTGGKFDGLLGPRSAAASPPAS